MEICRLCTSKTQCDAAVTAFETDLCKTLKESDVHADCNPIKARAKKAQNDDPLCPTRRRRLQFGDPGYYIIRANAPPGVNLPKDICDRMGLDNCRSGTLDPGTGRFTGNPMNQEESDESSGLSGAELSLVLLGAICGLCIGAMIAYLVYLAYHSQQRQCEPQEERGRGPVCRVNPNARCVRISVPVCEQI